MGRPLNMNPEDYARHIIAEQQKRIEELEQEAGAPSEDSLILEYSFSANTVAPPTGNQMRFDGADSSSTTKVWLTKLSNNGIDVTNYFAQFQAGDRMNIQDKNDATRYVRYALSDAAIITDYIEVPVSVVEAAGSLNGGQLVLMSMVKA